MSQSAARRRRLVQARAFPQAHCPDCGANLAAVFNPNKHLRRCAEERQARLSTRSLRP